MENKASTGNWWEKLGKPQYGGELVIRANRNILSFDPYITENLANLYSAWLERLVADDWTLDPTVFDYKTHWHPSRYMKGNMAESWEFTDPTTHVIHLRKGIHWQDIPPACGREFIADDVVFHYNRLCGLGGGYTKTASPPAPGLHDLVSVTATDKYTVVFKFKTPNTELIMEAIHKVYPSLCLENPDAVKKWGDLNDWHHAIGTGPFILQQFISGNSATLVKNSNYWAHDERYPQNQLPYIDTVKYLIIPDDETALEAMRTGKIDVLDVVKPWQAQAMRKSNPEILQIPHPNSDALTIEPRNDVKPFNDIRVRKAMQMAIDLPAIARDCYHNTVEPFPVMLTSRYMKGWGFPYEEWPQDLKDEYAYNPAVARQLLADAGYPHGFKTNIVTDAVKNLDLLQIVKSYFAAVGIDMEIRTMDRLAFVDFVMNGKKHDQLVHCPPGPLGHTASPFLELTRFRNGSGNWAMVDDPVFNSLLPKAMATTSYDDMKQLIREANERVARQHFTISLLQPMYYSLCQPWVKGFNAQHGSSWGHTGGPGMLSFYLGRFWIDRDLKKSMAH
jgi:peptide/nickel transport system substrate-binding protein